jgi:hypothetical protein
MFEQDAALASDPDIACYQVSEDGVTWRAFDPARDLGQRLHRRIEFAADAEPDRN